MLSHSEIAELEGCEFSMLQVHIIAVVAICVGLQLRPRSRTLAVRLGVTQAC